MKTTHKIKIILGDWSEDGHKQTETFYIMSNIPNNELQEAYRKAVDITRIDFENICAEYGEYRIDLETLKTLINKGMTFQDIIFDEYTEPFSSDDILKEDEINEETIALNTECYVELLMAFIQIGNPKLEWVHGVHVSDDAETFNGFWQENANWSFGYGLFSA